MIQELVGRDGSFSEAGTRMGPIRNCGLDGIRSNRVRPVRVPIRLCTLDRRHLSDRAQQRLLCNIVRCDADIVDGKGNMTRYDRYDADVAD